jgi:hypothetical protein
MARVVNCAQRFRDWLIMQEKKKKKAPLLPLHDLLFSLIRVGTAMRNLQAGLGPLSSR